MDLIGGNRFLLCFFNSLLPVIVWDHLKMWEGGSPGEGDQFQLRGSDHRVCESSSDASEIKTCI